jgi:uncharacterized protein (DUF305 family)
MGSIQNSGRGPFRTAAALLAAGAFLVGCGDDDTSKSASGNSTDRAFARSMIPHHEAAVEMAELAQERAQHRELRSLAKDIVASQTAEIRTLRRVEGDLQGKGVHHGDLGLDEHMMGMDHDIHGLESAREFDRAFIDMMVPHHQGAIRMSAIELRRGDDSQLRRLARDIIAAQKREIRRCRGGASPGTAVVAGGRCPGMAGRAAT